MCVLVTFLLPNHGTGNERELGTCSMMTLRRPAILKELPKQSILLPQLFKSVSD